MPKAKKPTTKLPVSATASAKAEVTAKVSYNRSKHITEETPADVIRARVGAWLKVFSPFVESQNLKGMKHRHAAEIEDLRHQATLENIRRELDAELKNRGEVARPIPLKALVPILQIASLEDPDSELIEAWGKLLASASVHFDMEVVTFADILSKMGARERTIIEWLLDGKGLGDWGDRRNRPLNEPGATLVDAQEGLKPLINAALDKQDRAIFEELKRRSVENFPMQFTRVLRSKSLTGYIRWEDPLEQQFYSDNFKGFEILKKLGIIQDGQAGFTIGMGEKALHVVWVEFTELGYAFVGRIVARAPARPSE